MHHPHKKQCEIAIITENIIIVEGQHFHRHKRRPALVFIQFINKSKYLTMSLTLNANTPTATQLVQALDVNGSVLGATDTITGHPTLQPGTLQVVSSDPSIFTVSVDPVTMLAAFTKLPGGGGTGTATAIAVNDLGETITGTLSVVVEADVVDTGIARSLQFAPAA